MISHDCEPFEFQFNFNLVYVRPNVKERWSVLRASYEAVVNLMKGILNKTVKMERQ